MLNLATAVIEVVGAGSIELCGLCDPRELETARYRISKAEASLGWRPEIALHDAIHSVATESFRR
jgi:nucleoside-diphosphate-sugar epimerase